MATRRIAILLVVLSLLLLGCSINLGPSAEPTATPVPPTNTPVPTDTPAPAVTKAPTNTPEPVETKAPTETPAPTDTPEPTNTPKTTEEPTERPTAGAEPTVKSSGSGGGGGIVKKPVGGGGGAGGTVFEFRSHTAWIGDYGDISIVGEVVNVSDQTVDTLVSVQAVLKDENGDTVQGDFGAYLDRPVIPPGEKSSFWVLITADQLGDVDPSTITDYELTLYISEDPSPDVELTVEDAEASEESDGFYITGTVSNQTDQSFDGLSVYSTLYDSDGNVINATVDVIDLDSPLDPGDSTDFTGWFPDHFEGADSFYVFVTGWPEEEGNKGDETGLRSGDGILEIQSHTGWMNDDGSASIVGEALNVSDETFDTLVIVDAILLDSDGNEIPGEFTAYLDRPVIPPGEISSFWVYISADSLGVAEPKDYELYLWITEDPSPDVELTVVDASASMESDAFYIEGVVENQTDLEFVALAVYSTLYDADGNVINATLDIIELDTPLRPGKKADFTGYFPDHFEDADSWYVFVTGYTKEAIGQ